MQHLKFPWIDGAQFVGVKKSNGVKCLLFYKSSSPEQKFEDGLDLGGPTISHRRYLNKYTALAGDARMVGSS